MRSKVQIRPSDSLNLTVVGGIMNNETGNGYSDRYVDNNGHDVEKYLEKKKDYLGLTGDANLGGKSTLSFRLTNHNPEYTKKCPHLRESAFPGPESSGVFYFSHGADTGRQDHDGFSKPPGELESGILH